MGRYKFSGVNGAKAAKTEARRFEVYDGPTPPRGPYLVKVQKCIVKANKNGDGMIVTSIVIDEPTKKDGKTNPKARYNGFFAMDRQNVTEESAGYVNSYLEALGCTPADIKSFWSSGILTEDDPNNADQDIVKSFGKVKPVGAHAMVLLGMGQARTVNGKTYEARMEPQSWLVASQITGSQPDDEDLDEDEEVEAEEDVDEEVEEDEGEDAEDEEDDEFAARQVELEGLSRTELKKALKAAGSDLRVVAKTKDEEIVNAILDIEFPPEDEDEPEEDEEPEEEEDEEGDDLDSLERIDLKRILKDEGIDFRVLKSTTDDQLREAIRAARGGDEEEEEEDEPEDEPAPAKKPARGRRSKGAGEPPF